jgi:integrase
LSLVESVRLGDADAIARDERALAVAVDEADWAQTRLTMYLLAFYGLRPAEVRGLTLNKVNATKKALTVDQQLAVIGDKGDKQTIIKEGAKTEAGTRVLPLSEPLLTVLKVQKARQRAAYDQGRRARLQGKELLVCGRRGGPLRQQSHNENWRHLITQEVRPPKSGGASLLWRDALRLYTCRHIATTIMQEAGFGSDTVALVNGWSTSKGNMFDVYGHWEDTTDVVKAVEAIGNALMCKGKPAGYATKVVGKIDGHPVTQAEADAWQNILDNEGEEMSVSDIADSEPPDDES